MRMKDKVSRLLAAGAIAAGAAMPITIAQLALAPAAHADGCGAGGAPRWGGGHGCRYVTPAGNTVDCGAGHGGPWGGGGCHIWGGPAGDIWCSGSVVAPFVVLWDLNPCPWIE